LSQSQFEIVEMERCDTAIPVARHLRRLPTTPASSEKQYCTGEAQSVLAHFA
jgi:hypothetical protein